MGVVTTRDGRLEGARAGEVTVWRGVPYAAPPVGALRFRAPHPVVPWTGVRPALARGASPPQPPSLPERVLGVEGRAPASEDCLGLEVWSPGPGGTPRPVMVWLHGGSFLNGAGSDPLYDGARMAARGDVVVVSVTYRLGPLGFLHFRDPVGGVADTNLGLRDQIAALAWVRDNIAEFGGDPGCVTLFGQSAGAMAIGALLGAPAARGLFHRAILQSGAAAHVHDAVAADRIVQVYQRALGLDRSDMVALRALPAETLVAASARLTARLSLTSLPFQPLIDGTLLPQAPLATIRAGGAAGVPLLLGTTRDEMNLYDVVADQDPTGSLGKRWRLWRATTELAIRLGPPRALRLAAAYRDAPGAPIAFAGDLVFRQPALDLAAAQDPYAPVFMFRFDWPSPAYGGRLGACHAVEVPFVWTTLDRPGAQVTARDGPAERALAVRMQNAWIAFARTGVPAAADLPDWPAYTAASRATMILDDDCRIEHDPRRAHRLAWT